MKTKVFCDIADYKTIKKFNLKSTVDGFTTNPSTLDSASAPLHLLSPDWHKVCSEQIGFLYWWGQYCTVEAKS